MYCNESCTISKDLKLCSLCPMALFITGLIGNLIALFIIYRHKSVSRGNNVSVFYVLVSGLVWTDLMGKVLLSPMVLVCYALIKCIEDINSHLCNTFAFVMSFFALCSMLILLAMAVECLLSIGYPYIYNRVVTRRRAQISLITIYAFSLLICVMPLIGFGEYRQYSPGTWCFINMNDSSLSKKAFSLLYAMLLTLAILAVVICNILVKINLMKMYKLTRSQSISGTSAQGTQSAPHPVELDHLALLVLMTLIFLICSIPVTVRLYAGAISPNKCVTREEEQRDLSAMRFLSVNSIVDPWVFIILRTSLCRKQVHKMFAKLCMSRASRTTAGSIDEYRSRIHGPALETEAPQCAPNEIQMEERDAS
ncbi:hypothetical protein AGOR_G00104660 [Albula goreensis]|uniref:G-protein coupled receptors family 1 profile domain-containing protein n=1 Tax=Albula goreensis TaxID=1534307 RepID=A0A8T3DCU2_9TELE|nr:hypothetical protein AGOR_G00104660 [Albula goreensis]